MQEFDLITSLGGTCLGLIATVITFFLKGHKNNLNKKRVQNLLLITNEMISFIKEAETFNNYTGEEKRQYVLTRIYKYAVDNKISFDIEQVSNKLEELIDFSNKVNMKNKKNDEIKTNEWLGGFKID